MSDTLKNAISDTDLMRYNKQGLIPSPNESEEAFLSRVHTCLGLKELLKAEGDQLPFKTGISGANELLEEAFVITQDFYDMHPSWLPVFFSNYQLTPWHGGCAWIFQLQEEAPRTAFLQLRKAFAYRKKYLKFYSRTELVAHECAHVGRMAFDQERFEELLAYRSSDSWFTRWLGPIVQSAGESLMFMGSLFALFVVDLYLILSDSYEMYLWVMWLKIIPFGLLIFGIGRLWQRHRVFNRCHANLKGATGSSETANHIIYRLTDDEIVNFSTLSSNEIIMVAKTNKNLSSLRWRLLTLAYF
ncbi:MAG: hypothetical protein H0W50_06890 [Parachlamydiaceae bacterium]|nr:hypothetical protein [Parachlamydiaceae bacterium]